MKETRIILLGILALLAGLLLPFIGLFNTPSYEKPYIIPLKPSLIEELHLGELYRLHNYTELINLIKKSSTTSSAGESIPLILTEGVYGGTLGITKQAYTVTATGAMPVNEVKETIEYSETNVQVEGIDEGDIVKTNGLLIVIGYKDHVYIIDPINDNVVSKILIGDMVKELYLVDHYLVVLSTTMIHRPHIYLLNSKETITIPPYNTTILVYDVSNPENPVLKINTTISGELVSSRYVNKTLYVVTTTPVKWNNYVVIPVIDNELIDPSTVILVSSSFEGIRSYTIVFALNIENGNYVELSFLSGSTDRIYMSHRHLVVISINDEIHRRVYVESLRVLASKISPRLLEDVNKYLANNDYSSALLILREQLYKIYVEKGEDKVRSIINEVNHELAGKRYSRNTSLYVFDVNGLTISYKGKLTVKGRILDQFSVEEYRGKYLLVATTYDEYIPRVVFDVAPIGYITPEDEIKTIVEDANGSRLVNVRIQRTDKDTEKYMYLWLDPVRVFRANIFTIYDLVDMKTVSYLDDIAPEERIYAARLVNDLFMLVTFRRIDPLFAINISDPYHPEIIGYLEIPGYMEYLHPLSGHILLGIGVDEDFNLVIRLYDISDPKNIIILSEAKIRGMRSLALSDYHAITFNYVKKTFYIPIGSFAYGEGWCIGCNGLAAVSYNDNRLVVERIIGLNGCSRALYIGDKLYAISPTLILIYNINTYDELGEIVLS